MGVRTETSDIDRKKIVDSYLDGVNSQTISSVLKIKLSAVYAAIALYKSEGRVEKKGVPANEEAVGRAMPAVQKLGR